jgi:hypothetical protein
MVSYYQGDKTVDCQQVSILTPLISHEIQHPQKAYYTCQESEECKDQSRS